MGGHTSQMGVPQIHLRGGNVACEMSNPATLSTRVQLQTLVNWNHYINSDHAFYLARSDIVPVLLDSRLEGQFLVKFEGQLDDSTHRLVSHEKSYVTNYVGDQAYLVHASLSHVQSLQHAVTPNAKIVWIGQYDPSLKIPTPLQNLFTFKSAGITELSDIHGIAASSMRHLEHIRLRKDQLAEFPLLTALSYHGLSENSLELTAFFSRPDASAVNALIARGQSITEKHQLAANFTAGSERLFTVRVAPLSAGKLLAWLVNQPEIQLVEQRPQMRILHQEKQFANEL